MEEEREVKEPKRVMAKQATRQIVFRPNLINGGVGGEDCMLVIEMKRNLTQIMLVAHLSERMPEPIAPTMTPNMYTLWR